MASGPNNGAFIIPASDVTAIDDFSIPGEKAGLTPDGTQNPSQPSYHLDREHSNITKRYYIYVRNGWDVDIEIRVRGTHFEDKNMDNPVIEQRPEQLLSGNVLVFEDKTGHSYIDVLIQRLTDTPSTGELEVIFQHRFR